MTKALPKVFSEKRFDARLFEILIDSLDIPVSLSDSFGQPIWHNEKWKNIFADTESIHLQEKPEARARWEKNLQAKTVHSDSVCIKCRDNEYRWFQWRAELVNCSGQFYWFSTYIDIDLVKTILDASLHARSKVVNVLTTSTSELKDALTALKPLVHVMNKTISTQSLTDRSAFKTIELATRIDSVVERLARSIENLTKGIVGDA